MRRDGWNERNGVLERWSQRMPYDRKLLLAGAKRNEVLELAEVQRYGSDCHGNADYVCIYGLKPVDWHARGIGLLGRTVVECTRDELGDAIGKDVAAVAAGAGDVARTLVVDPFAGSGNTLYWLLRHLPAASGLGFELDANVFRLTRHNLAALHLSIDVQHVDYRTGLSDVPDSLGQLVVVFIAPPWGDALDPASGLDLARTQPPIGEIVDFLAQRYQRSKLLCAIQVFEKTHGASLAAVQQRFDGSTLHCYSLNAPGHNHGVLIGTRGWRPAR
jgi:16S rRNA G966 N2-methylase RsmD